MAKIWLVEVYADDRCCDDYVTFGDFESAEEVENQILSIPEWDDIYDSYCFDWEDSFDEDDEDWRDMVAPHVKELSEEELNSESYMEWITGLSTINLHDNS